jgi:DNA gyrase/topoisomerase IV subunit A
MEQKTIYPISVLAGAEWKQFAMYTVENRAIPNLIDSLKPVQRFYLYSSLKNSKSEFKKVSAIAGAVSSYGYNHGETSCAAAGQLMAAEWSNNICLIQGRGSFGTRLVQEASAPRYTYTKVHSNFDKYIKDLDLSPVHEDPEHEPPAFYLPVIPLVLVNGIRGIATGFATHILPRDPEHLAQICKTYITTGKFNEKLRVKFPDFKGTVTYNKDENRYYCKGVYTKHSKTILVITELPYGYDRISYIEILNDLEEKGHIVSFEDQCDKDGFCFEVKLKNANSDWDDSKILSVFKLVKPFTENITVIDQNGKLKEYTNENDLIRDFCDFRMEILQKRIDKKKNEATELARWLLVKMEFIQAILDGKLIFKNKKKNELAKQICDFTSALESDIDRLLRINILSLTDELVKQLQKEIQDAKKDFEYWNQTTKLDQFISDLVELNTRSK